MSYVALYRKFRPKNFDEVVGQEHIVKTIKNQILNNRIGHAYLFSGGRGSGKTSTAKILARAVNCLHPINGEPCNECDICKQAIEGSLIDITEMDAASNNGVDNIRDIREEVEFIPTRAKYRVYIIDEVHMLSTGAFNALLKTLEEPPAHVIFILATTEPQKLPATILSRCQRFDFKRISIDDIIKRLSYICEQSDVKIEENALKMIANLADGAMRDAISILDRCISENDEIITEEKVRSLTGVPNFEYLTNMLVALLDKNIDKIVNLVSVLINEGKDVNVFLWELIKLLRDLLICMTGATLVAYTESNKNILENLKSRCSKSDVIYLINELSDLQSRLKWSTESTIILETGLIKTCLRNENTNNTNNSNTNTNTNTNTNVDTTKVSVNVENIKNDLKQSVLTKLKENGKIVVHSKLLNTRIEEGQDGLVHIIFDAPIDAFTKATLQKDETKLAIKEAVISALGKEISVKYEMKG